jgi:hypothetical protein
MNLHLSERNLRPVPMPMWTRSTVFTNMVEIEVRLRLRLALDSIRLDWIRFDSHLARSSPWFGWEKMKIRSAASHLNIYRQSFWCAGAGRRYHHRYQSSFDSCACALGLVTALLLLFCSFSTSTSTSLLRRREGKVSAHATKLWLHSTPSTHSQSSAAHVDRPNHSLSADTWRCSFKWTKYTI